MTSNESSGSRVHSLVHNLCEIWALIGGAVLLAVVLVNAYSIVSDILFTKPFPGDFEITEIGIGIAAFCFLPYCQITGSNVSADIFTAGASRGAIAIMAMFASIVAIAFSIFMLWRMSDGLLGYIEYEEVTGILSFPIWIAFIPCLMSLCLLVVSAFVSLADIYGTRRRA